MNIILLGFSTTGKSTILKDIERVIDSKIELLDSDYQISEEYNNHIYQLYLRKFDLCDPIERKEVLDEISNKENQFLEKLINNTKPYIAALGPNIHIRGNWKQYYDKCKPLTIFLKADPETVLNGLIRREENLKENESIAGFASWNQGVTRNYNHKTKLYESLPKLNALINVKKLIEINEKEYEKYASYTFESAQLFDWHKNYHEETKLNLINLIVKNAG